MPATSRLQLEASNESRVPALEEVRAGLWALPLAMPHRGLPYVLSYLLVGADGVVQVIDPGWPGDENWQRVLAALAKIGTTMERVETVTVTHLHGDHIGLAERYREASGARVAISRLDQDALTAAAELAAGGRAAAELAAGGREAAAGAAGGAEAAAGAVGGAEAAAGAAAEAGAGSGAATSGLAGASGRVAATGDSGEGMGATLMGWGVPEGRRGELLGAFAPAEEQAVEFTADVLLDHGDELKTAGRRLRVVATPGHTRGSICIVDEQEGVLFTGDTVLPDQFPGLGLGGPVPEGEQARNPVTEYLESLGRLEQFEGVEVLPGHGWRFTGLGERLENTAEHHERRTREAARVLAEHPEASVWQVAERLTWSSGWQNLRGPFMRSALAQTAMHLDRVRQG